MHEVLEYNINLEQHSLTSAFAASIHLHKLGLNARKTCLQGLQTTKAQTDPHLSFVIFESIISKLATGEISIFKLVSVAKETGLSLSLSDPPRHVLLHQGPVTCTSVDKGSDQIQMSSLAE